MTRTNVWTIDIEGLNNVSGHGHEEEKMDKSDN